MTNEQIFAAIYEYKLAKAYAVKIGQLFGACSQEFNIALGVLIAAESIVTRNNLQVEAGLKYANVWD